MCSPTRAALLTGLNAHAAGVGSVPHSDSGFPGYAMELAENAATIAETLRDNGWSTMAVGKWHLTKDAEQNAAGQQALVALPAGFERYYGVLDAFTNLHHPHRIVEDNHQVDVDQYPDGYFFTDDLTDRAISMIRETKAADPSKPFFLYFAHAAVHAPLHAKADDIAKYRGRYDAGLGRRPGGPVRAPEGARRHGAGRRDWRRATPSRATTCGRGPSCRPPSSSCSPVTWRSSPARSTTSTRTSVGC